MVTNGREGSSSCQHGTHAHVHVHDGDGTGAFFACGHSRDLEEAVVHVCLGGASACKCIGSDTQVAQYTFCVVSNDTRHTSHVTRHTSHVTPGKGISRSCCATHATGGDAIVRPSVSV